MGNSLINKMTGTRILQVISGAFLLLFTFPIHGAGPILVDTELTGHAVVWRSGAVSFNTESGDDAGLGRLTNEEAKDLLHQFFDDWANITIGGIASVSLTVQEGEGLGSVDGTNFDTQFTYCPPDEVCPTEDPPFIVGTARTGQSPILFDNDGQMTDMVFGTGANDSVLGFAGPRVVERIDGELYITESQGVLNGLFIDCPDEATATDPCRSPEVTVDEFSGAIFHEVGHFLGIDHTQVNLGSAVKALNGDDSEAEAIPTMLPLFIDGEAQRTPHFDDQVAVAILYPSAAFQASFCTISGTVFQSDGETEFQGVNVVARNENNPLLESTSFVSGSFYTGTSEDCEAEEGGFVIGGIAPAIRYTVEVEPVSPSFTSGSSLEPCDPPARGFDAEEIPGTFSCTSGGEVITTGSVTDTNLVTTKESTGTTPRLSRASPSGCSLIP